MTEHQVEEIDAHLSIRKDSSDIISYLFSYSHHFEFLPKIISQLNEYNDPGKVREIESLVFFVNSLIKQDGVKIDERSIENLNQLLDIFILVSAKINCFALDYILMFLLVQSRGVLLQDKIRSNDFYLQWINNQIHHKFLNSSKIYQKSIVRLLEFSISDINLRKPEFSVNWVLESVKVCNFDSKVIKRISFLVSPDQPESSQSVIITRIVDYFLNELDSSNSECQINVFMTGILNIVKSIHLSILLDFLPKVKIAISKCISRYGDSFKISETLGQIYEMLISSLVKILPAKEIIEHTFEILLLILNAFTKTCLSAYIYCLEVSINQIPGVTFFEWYMNQAMSVLDFLNSLFMLENNKIEFNREQIKALQISNEVDIFDVLDDYFGLIRKLIQLYPGFKSSWKGFEVFLFVVNNSLCPEVIINARAILPTLQTLLSDSMTNSQSPLMTSVNYWNEIVIRSIKTLSSGILNTKEMSRVLRLQFDICQFTQQITVGDIIGCVRNMNPVLITPKEQEEFVRQLIMDNNSFSVKGNEDLLINLTDFLIDRIKRLYY